MTRSTVGEAPCVYQTQGASIEVENSMLVTFSSLTVELLLCRYSCPHTIGGPGGMVGPRRRGGDGGGPHPLYQVRRGPGAWSSQWQGPRLVSTPVAGPPPDTPCSWTAASNTLQVRSHGVAPGSLAVVRVDCGCGGHQVISKKGGKGQEMVTINI